VWAGGDRHEGEYANDLRHGYGVYTWAVSGDRFEGFWLHGAQTGRGTYTYGASGDVFKGKWVDGKKVGRGIFTRGGESWLEEWADGVRQARSPCKFFPPRLLRTYKDADGSAALNGADAAASIRSEIDRLRAKLTAVQRGEQWQQHVQSSAFNSLVLRSVAAMLSPEQAAAPPAPTDDGVVVPSPAAAIEAAATTAASADALDSNAALHDLSIDINLAEAVASGSSPSISPLPGSMEASSADGMELLTVNGHHGLPSSSTATIRPISPLITCRPSSATADSAMPASAAAAAGASTARCATPHLPAAAGSITVGQSPRASTPQPEDHLCKVCFANDMNTVLLPCAHVAVCFECSTQLERCCICRTTIKDVIQTFKA